MVLSIVIIATAIAGLLLYARSRKREPSTLRAIPRDATNAFHAVSVRPGLSSCAAARTVNGTRFLSAEAPQLPLPDCDETTCTCRFAHHNDRRANDDRRSPFQTSAGITLTQTNGERRRKTDRRHSGDQDGLLAS
ncbi:MAG: hypothetical protein HKN35_05050 [Woeseia sp.]|nr:hypothetical protein [Woeseia sp.]MBT8095765.1 hypothetical protein [Woeseia sp.]NNE60236.1 hypothetical protein [Woeseia sp.]NNL55147.1 hypothetical protein [Woeseia sp.]